MRLIITAALVASAITLMPAAASAGDRVNGAVVGGVSGLLVAGPVGLVAGGVVGYTAGPSIARGLRGERRYPRRQYRTVRSERYRN